MHRDFQASLGSPRARLILQAIGFVTLTGLLFQILSGEKALLFLQATLGGICALWLIRQPHWGVLIILTLWFVEFSPPLFGMKYLRIPYLVSALLLVPLLVLIWQDRQIWVWRVPQVKILVAIGLLLLVSTAWSSYKHPVTLIPELDDTREMLQQFVTRLIFLIFFLYFIATRARIELATWVIVLLIAAAALDALYHFFLPGAGRAWASFGSGRNANRLASLCLFGMSLLWFYRAYAPAQRWKQVALLLFAPLPIITLASGSRAGLLQLLTLIVLILKEQEGWSAAKRIRSFLFLGGLSLLVVAIAPAGNLLRATTFELSASAPGGESLRNRLQTIYAALEMIVTDPILGIGIGNFRWMHQAFYGSALTPHNSYLWAILSGGIGVLGLYLMLFVSTYRMLRQLEKTGPRALLWLSKGLRVNLLLFLVASLAADIWLHELTYVIIGLTVALTHLGQLQDQQPAAVRPSHGPSYVSAVSTAQG